MEKLAARLKSAVQSRDPVPDVFFAPTHLRAGGAWTDQLAQALGQSDAFILLIGEHGVGKWQVPEYDEALDRWVKSGPPFPLVTGFSASRIWYCQVRVIGALDDPASATSRGRRLL